MPKCTLLDSVSPRALTNAIEPEALNRKSLNLVFFRETLRKAWQAAVNAAVWAIVTPRSVIGDELAKPTRSKISKLIKEIILERLWSSGWLVTCNSKRIKRRVICHRTWCIVDTSRTKIEYTALSGFTLTHIAILLALASTALKSRTECAAWIPRMSTFNLTYTYNVSYLQGFIPSLAPFLISLPSPVRCPKKA